MENRMMIEDEIEMLQAIIDGKEELQCNCNEKLEQVAGGVQYLEEVGNAQEQAVKALLLKIGEDKKESRKEMANVKKDAHLVEEENKKLKAVCNNVKKESLETNEELKDLRIKEGKQKQEISALKAQITKDEGKHEEKVQDMKKSFEKDRTDLESLSRSKLEEEAKKVKELVAKHKQFVEVLSDKIECPVSSKKCCPNSGPSKTAENSLVVLERYTLKPVMIESKNLFYPVQLFSLDGYDLCIFPEKDAGNFYFSCVMVCSEAVCSQYKIEMSVQAEESPLDSEVSFKFFGKPSSIDEDYIETKHYGLVVSAKAMGKMSKKGNDFYISVFVKKV